MKTSKPLGEVGVSVHDCEHKTPAAQNSGHPYIAIPDIIDGRIDISTTRKISDEDLQIWTRRTTPQVGDIVVTRRGRVGDTAPIPQENCAIGQNLVLLRSDETQVLQEYLRWATRSPSWYDEVDRYLNVGAVFSSLNVRDIPKLSIPVPSLSIQQAIAEVLGALDDKIAANNRLAQIELEYMETVYRAVALAQTPLEEISEITMGTSPKSGDLNESATGIPFFQGGRDFTELIPSKRVFTEKPVRTAKPMSTLMTVRAPVGNVNLTVSGCAIGRGVAAFHSTDQAATLFTALASHSDSWEEIANTGTVFSSVTAAQVRNHVIQYPIVQNRSATETVLRPHLERAIAAVNENEVLARTRDELLPLLMNGTITVREAEDRTKEVP